MRTALLPFACLPLLLTACLGGGGGGDASPTITPSTGTPRPVSIRFALKSGSATVGCGTAIRNLGTDALTAELKDARLYVHDLQLITAQGRAVPVRLTQDGQWQYRDTALLDFENATGACAAGSAATNTQVQGTVDDGHYVGLSFRVGVPATATDSNGNLVGMNHLPYATAPAPLNLQAMSWNWQVGRKFMKVELNPAGGILRPATASTPATTASTFNIHLGATNCTGGDAVTGIGVSCSNPNQVPVRFAAFNPLTQQVVLDIQQLLAGSRLSQDNGGAFGCMSNIADGECQALFDQLGLHFTGSSGGQPNGDGSRVPAFRAEDA